jgi:hypothetical protein
MGPLTDFDMKSCVALSQLNFATQQSTLASAVTCALQGNLFLLANLSVANVAAFGVGRRKMTTRTGRETFMLPLKRSTRSTYDHLCGRYSAAEVYLHGTTLPGNFIFKAQSAGIATYTSS